jgi:hypothetical protein
MIRKIAARLDIDPNWLAFGRGRAPTLRKWHGGLLNGSQPNANWKISALPDGGMAVTAGAA